MLFLSLSKFIQWLPFLIAGLLIYYVSSTLFVQYSKKFTLQGTLYYKVADVIIPINFLVAVSIDLYFLYHGDAILLVSPNPLILSLGLSVISFIIGLFDVSSYFSVYMMNQRQIMKAFFTIIAITIPVMIFLSLLIILRYSTLLSVIPILSLAMGSLLSIPLPKTRFRPSFLLSVPLVIIVLSITYLFYVIVHFG